MLNGTKILDTKNFTFVYFPKIIPNWRIYQEESFDFLTIKILEATRI